MTNKLAIEINDVLHKALGSNDSLAYHMARGLSEKIAEAVSSEYQPWEYVVRSFERDSEKGMSNVSLTRQLDEDGGQEWELVTFDFATYRAVFKRKRRDR